jgi:hypothetical protein
MTATVSVLPLRRAGHLTVARRAEILADVAENHGSLLPEATAILVGACGSGSLTAAERQRAWSEYLSRREIYDDLVCGRRGYECVAPDLTCPDRHSTATEIALQDTCDALSYLVAGTAGAVR